MVKNILLSLLVLASVSRAATPRKIAFERNDNAIWVTNLDGTGAKKLTAGVDPDISPDGAKVAFNTESSSGPVRHIAVADVATGSVVVFKNVPSDNCFGPVWSPDATRILFYALIDNNWDIAEVNSDGTGFRLIKKATPNGTSCFSACWTPDGQSLYCQDLNNLYHIGLDGSVIKQWSLDKLFSRASFDSNDRFSVSADGKTLLVDLGLDEEPTIKDWDGPPPAIELLDLTTEKSRKLTSQFWWDPCWLGPTEILCISQSAKEKQPSIYRVTIQGPTHTLLIKNASNPSVSN